MNLLMGDPLLANEMGKRGRQRIEQDFDITKMTDSYIQLYNKCSYTNRRLSHNNYKLA